MTSAASNTTCGFQGNSDIYGVGIRIGYYTQALAAWFANFFFLQDAKVLQGTNSLFLFALAIVIVIYAAKPAQVQAVEILLLITIEGTLLITTISKQSRYSSRFLQRPWLRKLLYRCIYLVGMGYGTYFWWYGLDTMISTPCGIYAVLIFARADIYGPIRTVMKAAFAFLTTWNLVAVIPRESALYLRDHYMKKTRSRFIQAATTVYTFLELLDEAEYHSKITTKSSAPIQAAPDHTKAALPSRPVRESLICFEAVREAEEYLDYVFGPIGSEEIPLSTASCLARLPPKIRAKCCYPTLRVLWDDWWRARRTSLQHVGQLKIVQTMLAMHSQTLRRPHYLWPRTVRRMKEREQQHHPIPTWDQVAIASDVQASRLPLYVSRTWTIQALNRLGSVLALIIHVELIIYWNQISGLQGLSTVCQLSVNSFP